MVTFFVCSVFVLGLMSGCDQLKGPKGDTGATGPKGDTGLIGTKTYTGVPTSNPYTVSCPEITDPSKQVVECYMRAPNGDLSTGMIKLPTTLDGYSHAAAIATGAVSFLTEKVSDSSLPSTALSNPVTSYQWAYTIVIKTFASAPAKAEYLSSRKVIYSVPLP